MNPSYLRIFSDIHLDFDLNRARYCSVNQVWQPSVLDTDSETVLILAGDLWANNKFFEKPEDGKSWLSTVAPRFHSIIVILGNHDYWGTSLQSAVKKARIGCSDESFTNVHFMENDKVIIGNLKFLGGTLWTDYNRSDLYAQVARQYLNDFNYITFGENNKRRKIRSDDLFELHRQTAKFIFNNVVRDNENQKVIVVTHMAPHEQSINAKYKNNRDWALNYSYFSDLTHSLESHGKNIDLWIHGHVHDPVDYIAPGNIRVFANPRGYENYEGTSYNSDGLMTIESIGNNGTYEN